MCKQKGVGQGEVGWYMHAKGGNSSCNLSNSKSFSASVH